MYILLLWEFNKNKKTSFETTRRSISEERSYMNQSLPYCWPKSEYVIFNNSSSDVVQYLHGLEAMYLF